MSGPAPVSDEEFAGLMAAAAPFGRERRVMVAVSGGADSMALAVLLARWGCPIATIVDHGLRPDSAAEAALVSTRLAGLGIENRVVTASLPQGPALAARARSTRYDLLFTECARLGTPDLLVGHHAGDQAETVRMRADSGSGTAGLAGMAVVSYRNVARLIRPLLAIDPARLRTTLHVAGVPWVEDPTNHSLNTARGRLRHAMTPSDSAAALAMAAASQGDRSAQLRSVACELAGVRLAPEGFAIVPDTLGEIALSALIWMISGGVHPPPRAALAPGLRARTLHGVLIRPAGRLGPGTLLTREPAAVASPITAHDGAVWDGRFRVHGASAGLSLGALGAEAVTMRGRSTLPAVVLASLPALRRGTTLVAVPHLAFPDREACRSVSIEMWPGRQATPSA